MSWRVLSRVLGRRTVNVCVPWVSVWMCLCFCVRLFFHVLQRWRCIFMVIRMKAWLLLKVGGKKRSHRQRSSIAPRAEQPLPQKKKRLTADCRPSDAETYPWVLSPTSRGATTEKCWRRVCSSVACRSAVTPVHADFVPLLGGFSLTCLSRGSLPMRPCHEVGTQGWCRTLCPCSCAPRRWQGKTCGVDTARFSRASCSVFAHSP